MDKCDQLDFLGRYGFIHYVASLSFFVIMLLLSFEPGTCGGVI